MPKHTMIKNMEEMGEVKYCIYCGSTLIHAVTFKICPNDCVKISFASPEEALSEVMKEITQEESNRMKKRKPLDCHCEYPMVS
jgi:hypothetical protein